MKISMTGHRPEKIPDPTTVREAIADGFEAFRWLNPELTIIQGMASGVDLWSAKVAKDMGIPFWCARPWAGHKPRKADVALYEGALRDCEKSYDVSLSTNYPGSWVYQKRNEWMVKEADVVFAVWDGSGGGTGNCVEYALRKKKPVYCYDPQTRLFDWL